VKARMILALVLAVAAGLAAAYLVASRGAPRHGGNDADYYCYELRQVWVCSYARSECEARLAREVPSAIQKRCTAQTNDPPSP
jgi:hypothetical protein